MTTTNNTTPVPGDSVLIRLGRIRHTGIPWIPPTVRLKQSLIHAQTHDGRLLWLTDAKILNRVTRADHAIIIDADSSLAITGSIIEAGMYYEPDHWKMPYTSPTPWDSEPWASWVALDDVHAIEFNPDQYRRLTGRKTVRETITGPGFPATLITPIEGAAS